MDAYAQGLKFSAQGRHAEAIEQFERALAERPDDTRTLFALGNTARALGMKQPAEAFFRRVLALEPGRLEAIINLANLLRADGQFAAAEAVLAPALARNPETPELWLTMGSTAREMGDAERARAHYRQAIALKPNCAAALSNLADLMADSGEHDEAMALYDGALASDSGAAQPRLNRAILHFLRGELTDGWRDYEARLKVPGKVPVPDLSLPRWRGGPLKRTRLLIRAEQGVGDQIMFASLFGDLCARAADEGASLILECEPRLVELFARSFPAMKVHAWQIELSRGTVRTRYDWLKQRGGANADVEMGSLPRYLRKSITSFPSPNAYLIPDPAERERWQAAFAGLPRPLIGVCWRSGLMGGARAVQYAPQEAWASFLRDVPGTPVCAQYDAMPEEIAALSAMCGRRIVAPEGIDQKQELDRAVALFSALDAMISAPTAVSWLSAAAGLPTLKVLYDTSWTSFAERYEPFAPAARCLMPAERGDWMDVFAQAREAISSLPA
jgi:tetratricopeptide (TPR) repeat protein